MSPALQTPPPRYPLLGVGVHATRYTEAVDMIIDAAVQRRRCTVSASAVHSVMSGALDAEHRERLNGLDLVTPDGQPVRWALNWLHHANLPDRVYGPFLMGEVCARAADEGLPVFFYGSDAATLERLVARLRSRWPSLHVAGTQASRFRQAIETEWEEDVVAIRESGARIVFCGLGCPRQEVWAYEMGQELSLPLIAVGAAFSFHAGTLAMAPAWMQRSGLEWLYRVFREPRRLWRRYLVYNSLFVYRVLQQKLGFQREPEATRTAPKPQRWS